MRRADFMTGWMAAVLCLAAGAASPCLAQRNNFHPAAQQSQYRQQPNQYHPQQPNQYRQPATPGPGHAGDWLRRYKNVPPGEQERALRSDPAFRRLSPEQQQLLRQRLQHFSGLPPQEQQRMLNRMETWEHLTPQQKQWARQVHGELQQLPPQRRGMVMNAVHGLRALPPQQREQIIDSYRFRTMFSPQERDIMRGASRLPLAPPENRPPE